MLRGVFVAFFAVQVLCRVVPHIDDVFSVLCDLKMWVPKVIFSTDFWHPPYLKKDKGKCSIYCNLLKEILKDIYGEQERQWKQNYQ